MIIEKSALFEELDSLPLLSFTNDSTQVDITRLIHHLRNEARSMRNECVLLVEDKEELLLWEEDGSRKYKNAPPPIMLPVEKLQENYLFEYAIETDPKISNDSSGFVTFLLIPGS